MKTVTRYTEGYLLPTNAEQDKEMMNVAEREINEDYNVMNNSCIDVCSVALDVAGFNGGENPSYMVGVAGEYVPSKRGSKNPIPNVRYKNIKRNNPWGRVFEFIRNVSD